MVDEKSYMALDDEMKKKYIILDPSAEPFKLHHLNDLHQFIPSKESLELTVMPVNTSFQRGSFKNKRGGRYNNNNYNHSSNSQHHFGYNSQQYHNGGGGGGHSGQTQQPQMAFVSEIERDANFQPQEQQEPQGYYQQQQAAPPVQGSYQETCSYEQQPIQAAPSFYQQLPPPHNWNNQLIPFISSQPMQYAAPLNYQQIMPYGNFSIPPPPATVVQQSGIESTTGDLMNIIRENELACPAVNWNPKEVVDADLPLNDIPTLKFYYNLGVRYFLASGTQRRLESVAHQLEALNLNESSQNTNEKSTEQPAATKVDAPPVPTNTPVTTKSIGGSYGPPPGNRYHNNSHGNFRRPFASGQNSGRDYNRDGNGYRGNNFNNHPRKEIKFNSNVKNAHKADTKSSGSGSQNSNNTGVQTQTFHASNAGVTNTGANSGASPNVHSNQEKTSPGAAVPQFSPISPIVQDGSQVQYQHQQQIQMMPVDGAQIQQGYYQPYPAPQAFVPQQQQGVAMVYQMTEDGGYVMHQVQQPIQYQQPYRKYCVFAYQFCT